MWKLFLDDERFPVDESYVIARSSSEAIEMIKEQGMPESIAFDHDLGGADTSIKLIWWMIDELLDKRLILPDNFAYTVHSQNPIGAKNIKNLLDGFLESEYS